MISLSYRYSPLFINGHVDCYPRVSVTISNSHQLLIHSGASTRTSRAWDRTPSSWNLVNLFSLGCHVIDQAYTRLQIVRVGVGETIKRKGRMSQACLGKSTSFIWDIHNMVNWQLSKQDYHWPVSHDHIAGSFVNSSRWRDLFGSCPLTS